MNRNAAETVVGAVVLVIAAVFLFFAYTTTRVHVATGYEVTASFDRVEGIRDGGDVRISGIKVGTIVSQTLDPKTFRAVVRMNIDPNLKLSTDTVATITSSGLLSDKYLSLVPGNLDEYIKPGGQIEQTNSPVSLEALLGQVIYSVGGQKDQQKKDDDNGRPK